MSIKSKGIGGHQSANMRTDEWLTPPEIIRSLGEFDLDPCSPINRPWDTAKNHFSFLDNGLIKEWFGRIWLNPPYGSECERWMRRMAFHNNGIALIFARTETKMFFDTVWNNAHSILFVQGRLFFHTVDGKRAKYSGGAPSVLISYGEENTDSLSNSKISGKHILVNAPSIIVVGVSPTWISIVSIAFKNHGDNSLQPIYEMVERIAPDKVAQNKHWKEKIRQQIQILRKRNNNAVD